MMRWIIGTSTSLRYLVLVLAAAFLVYGVVQLDDMPVDVFPEFDPPMVEIQTEALGLSAAEMEALITVPLEADLLNGVAWLDQIYSESVAGLSSILLVFEPGTDPIRARQMVQERLTQTFALPNVSKPPTMLQPLSSTSRVMMVGLSSEELSLIDLGVLARWNIKPRLMGVPGVANVAIWGQREWQLQVQVDPEQLQERGVTLRQVVETTGEALWVSPLSYLESSTPGTAGWIDTPNQRLSLQHDLPISSAADLARVPVKGTAWRLGEVARVVEDRQPLIGDALLDEGPGLLLVIEKFPGANTLDVTRGVEDALEAMQPGLTGIEIDTTIFRPADYIEQAAANLSWALSIGAVLAIVALALFFSEWRAVLISFTAIGTSLLAAVTLLHLRGATFNMMLLAGLVVALIVIVDDAIVLTENIGRRLRHENGDDGSAPARVVLTEAIVEARGPINFATLIIFLAVLPLFVLGGLTGSFFRPLVVTYVLAVLTSIAVALIITPALSLILYPIPPDERQPSRIFRLVQQAYDRILDRTVNASTPLIISAAVIILIGIATIPLLERGPLPTMRQTYLRIQWEGPPGTSRREMNRVATQASGELQTIPGVTNVASHVGRAITGDQVVGIHSGDIWISLDPHADYEATLASIQEVIAGYPGVLRQVGTYLPERIEEALGGPDRDLVIRLYGHEYDVLRSKAEEIGRSVSGLAGVTGYRVEPQIERPQVEIEVDLPSAERYQVKPGDVRRSAAILLSGLQVGNLYEGQKVFDVVVWGVPEIRESLTDVRRLLIDTPRGGHVRLEDVAEVRIEPAPVVIKRDAVSRFIDINVAVRGRSLGSVAGDVDRQLEQISFPLEYHAEVVGATAERQAGQQRLLLISVVAAIGMFLLLQAAIESWRLALVFTLAVPTAMTGGLLAALADGGVVSFASLIGFLAVLAVSMRNGTSLIRHFQNLEWVDGHAFGQELVLRGARQRLRPILLTAVVTALMLLPLTIAGGLAGNELVRPTAVVILGGLITSTLLILVLLPSLYLRFGRRPTPEEELAPAAAQLGAVP